MAAPPFLSVEPDESIRAEDRTSVSSDRGSIQRQALAAEPGRVACESVAAFGTLAGWGLAVLGVLCGANRLMQATADGSPSRQTWAPVVLGAVIAFLTLLLAGWALAVFSRLIAAALLDHFGQVSQRSDRLADELSRAVALLERLTTALENGRAPTISGPAAPGRARSLAEIARATRSADWVDATARLNEFESEFPDDPDLSTLKEELADARERRARESLAQLEAARAVSDADRVFEIYLDVAPLLPDEQRSSLDQDLAKWFLSLIHRRLRTGRVQPEVVQLATRFAENFASTVEGASVRASLPTLRRSVGLCPRCAEPYIGVADACPNCLKGASPALSDLPVGVDADGSE